MVRVNNGPRGILRAASVLALFFVSACGDGSSPTDPAFGKVDTPNGTTSNPGGQGSNQGKAPFIVILAEKENPAGVAAAHGIQPKHTFTHVLNGFAGDISDAARSGLLKDSRVVRVEKDEEVGIQEGVQNSPPWGLDRIDQRARDMDGVYQYQQTGLGVTAYVVDTGIRFEHVEFSGRASSGYDVFGEDGTDCNGHGTHVAGILGGVTYGVAKEVNLVSVRVLGCSGWGFNSGVVAGLDWIAANAEGPSVVNMSLLSAGSTAVDEAVANLVDSGVTAVVAAGNDDLDACSFSPARAQAAVTVGAVAWTDVRAAFSNWGPCVDLFAPGVSIPSAAFGSDSAVESRSGTSMASPHVAGTAALYLSQAPAASPAQVRDALASSATVGIVGSAKSQNNHLVFTLGFGDPPDGGESPNSPPTASFTAYCQQLTCLFPDLSSDPDGLLVEWKWNFGDGIEEVHTGSSSQTGQEHTYQEPGTYTVLLTVTDDKGASDTHTQTVTVAGDGSSNLPPSAEFVVTCQALACSFSDQSTDPDGTLSQWDWNYGDGVVEVFSESPGPSGFGHTYQAPGTYTVLLTVTDNDGASDTRSQTVTVTDGEPANLPPSADFEVSCQALECTFSDQSTDPDGYLVEWNWEFGDGTNQVLTAGSETSSRTHSYAGPGTYSATLTVTDDGGASHARSRSVTVEVPPPPAGIELTAIGMKEKGRHVIELFWDGAESDLVDIWLDGSVLETTENDGEHLYRTRNLGKGFYLFMVCEAESTRCSPEVEVVF